MVATVRYAQRFCLPDIDDTFAAGVAAEDVGLLRRVLTVPGEAIEPGPWDPGAAQEAGQGAFAMVVLDGLLAADVLMAERASTMLIGSGDVFSPWDESDSLIPFARRWTVLVPTHVAVLEGRFLLATRRWPHLVVGLYDRLAEQARRASLDKAILQLPNAELRVLGVLWHLADRFGRVGPNGVVLPLRLTHGALGGLIGAERPTVTLALRALARSGVVERDPEGRWLLREGSQAAFAALPEAPPADAIQIDPVEPLRPPREAPASDGGHDVTAADMASVVSAATTLREELEHHRARLETLLTANREIVAAAGRMRAEVAEQRRRRLATPPRRAP